MLSTDRKEFCTLVARYLRNWDKKPPDAEQMDLWFDALRDLAVSDIDRAFRVCVGASKFAPRPADIRTKITGKEGSGGAIEGNALCGVEGCRERWVWSGADGRKCRTHLGGRPTPKHPWSQIMCAHVCIEKFGEVKARKCYGPELVQLILSHNEIDFKNSTADQIQAALA